MSAQKLQEVAPLQAEALRQLRTKGAAAADLSIFGHEGQEYVMRVDTPCKMAVHLVTLEWVGGRADGYKQSMVALRWERKDGFAVDGLHLALRAFKDGMPVDDSADHLHGDNWRVLPWVQVPPQYLADAGDKGVPHG